MPQLSEKKVAGIYVIGLICAVPVTVSDVLLTNKHGVEQDSRIAGVVVILGLAIYIVFRLTALYKHVGSSEMTDQKLVDRILSMGIAGLAALLIFETSMSRIGQFQSVGTIGEIVTIYVGMRALAGFLTLTFYTSYDRNYRGGSGHRHRHSTQWVGGLLEDSYDSTQISHWGFVLSVLLAFVCSLVGIVLYKAPAQQIIIAYALLAIILKLDPRIHKHS